MSQANITKISRFLTWKLIFLPISICYGAMTFVRNVLYDIGWLKSYKSPIYTIGIGNLSLGGTGKTPHVIYTVQTLLKKNKKVAILSRGYGRSTKTLIHIQPHHKLEEVGDEPYMYYKRFQENVPIILEKNRKKGLRFIETNFPKVDVVVLDDCFQHRRIKVDYMVLLTPYHQLFTKDLLFPMGRLRELSRGKKRADMVVVSKSPKTILTNQQNDIKNALNVANLTFSSIVYRQAIHHKTNKTVDLNDANILLVTGIADKKPIVDYLKSISKSMHHISFGDHHNYTLSEAHKINQKREKISTNTILLTTEKDINKLQNFDVLAFKLHVLYIDVVCHYLYDAT